MKTNKIKIVFLLFVFFSSCKIKEELIVKNSSEISAILKISKRNNCNEFCYYAELYLKNNSKNSLYIKPVFILNANYRNKNITKNGYTMMRRYNNKHFINSNKQLPERFSCISGYHKAKEIFLDEAANLEIERILRQNKLDSINKKDENKFREETKRAYNMYYFLEPFEECKVDYRIIDTFILKKREYKIYFLFDIAYFDSALVKRTLSDDTIIERPVGFFPEIAGYKLFLGRVQSNTLVIKGDSVLADIPAAEYEIVKVKKKKKK